MTWIPITDHTPDEPGRYLMTIVHPDGEKSVDAVTYVPGVELWLGDLANVEVTHWQDMPEVAQ